MVRIDKIMCAVDFSQISVKVASYAQLIAQSLNASVRVLHVAPSLTEYVAFHLPPTSLDKMEKIVGDVMGKAERTMESFVRENFSNVDVTGKVMKGYAPEKILNFVRDEDIQLIIMGTHGHTGIKRVLFGSVAENIVKKASVPVITIRP